MNRKPELDKLIQDKIDTYLQQSAALMREGKIQESIDASLKAWTAIPEPKEKWDYYPQTMAVSLVTRFRLLKDLKKTKKWIAETYRMYGDPQRESQ